MITGMAAPFVAYALHRHGRRCWPAAWNIFGFGDLINVRLAAQNTPGVGLRSRWATTRGFSLFPTGLLRSCDAPIAISPLFSMRARAMFATEPALPERACYRSRTCAVVPAPRGARRIDVLGEHQPL
jgi:hypothetical protein